MDKLVAPEVEKEKQSRVEEKVEKKAPVENTLTENQKYLNSFQNKTLADFRKEKEAEELKKFQTEKQELLKKQFEVVQKPSENVIEKPNYDLIEENKKIIKLKKRQKTEPKKKHKFGALALAIGLGVGAVICVGNFVGLEQISQSYNQAEYEYTLNLRSYLKNLSKLDANKKNMQFLETYPDEMYDAGDVGKVTNWFDNLCNYLAGFFGG